MQSYLYDRTYDTGSLEFQGYHFLIETLKHRFQTYGYQQVRTSTFEQYDLYHSVSGSINRDHMVKVIDQSGKVLVMRPDVTIPLTRMAAFSEIEESRLFYMLNVFRQYPDSTELKERLQAGIERFGNDQPETDAEVITLAIHALKDLEFQQFKIEVGHAGFFKEVIQCLDLTRNEKEQLQILIQSKNLADIQPFLKKLHVSSDVVQILESIPLLYGAPKDVLERVQRLPLTVNMQRKIDDLQKIYTLLVANDVTEHIVLDFGLINNMDYYSGVIFQGFVAGYGKPVVMGGRYNQLANQFGTTLPAIGFAYEVGYLLEALKQENQSEHKRKQVDITLIYEKSMQVTAFKSARALREAGYSLITNPCQEDVQASKHSMYIADFKVDGNHLYHKQTVKKFADATELIRLLKNSHGDE